MSPVSNRYNFCIEVILCLVLILSLINIPATALTTTAFANIPKPLPANLPSQPGPGGAYSTLPLSFELNQGQTNDRVKFLTRSEGYVLFLTATEAVMALDNPTVHKKGKENRESHNHIEDRKLGESVDSSSRRIVRMKMECVNYGLQIVGTRYV